MADSPVLKSGAVALVVGAGSGIGEAVAVSLAGRGCRVICAGRRVERLSRLAGRLGSGAHPFRLDVTDPESTASVIERLPEDARQIDILVNSAGHDIGGRRRFDLGQAQDWADIVDTNVTGLLRVCHAVIPRMLARGVGHVVNIGSNAGLHPYAGGTAYVASKFAVRGFSDALRLDYQDTELRITEIQPGMTRTEFAQMRLHGDQDGGERYYDQAAQCLAADDVARAVVFALEQPAHVTIARLLIMPTREHAS